jgi:hypothetical protein
MHKIQTVEVNRHIYRNDDETNIFNIYKLKEEKEEENEQRDMWSKCTKYKR